VVEPAVLVIDQGTTGTAVSLVDRRGAIVAQVDQEFRQYYPQPGWVEHDPDEIWESVLAGVRAALQQAEGRYAPVALGITNQRETTVLWERATGKPVARAIVWQDRRTAVACDHLRQSGVEDLVRTRTGLLLDPYFSATKIAWLLDTIPGARRRAEAGELAVGTIDSWLIWRLSGGKAHITDRTNASRTLLYSLLTERWDEDLCRIFAVTPAVLPEVVPSCGPVALTAPGDAAGADATHLRHCRRSAGGPLRPDLLCRWPGEEYLRHRLLSVGTDRPAAGPLAGPAPDHRRHRRR